MELVRNLVLDNVVIKFDVDLVVFVNLQDLLLELRFCFKLLWAKSSNGLLT